MVDYKAYYAFISYKREDEKWAKWLQDKLEHYRFPSNLNGRTDLPKNIRPTFRDVTDLNPGLLSEEIDNALRNSKWLIVVCSPRSAKSPWVCKEAQTFIDLGRGDHIIPFVIEGNPFSNDHNTECFPEALLSLTGSRELLAANIHEMGRDAAAVKVVSRMFDLRFDTLWQRYKREQKKKRRVSIGSAFLLALFGLSIGGFFVKQNRIIENQNNQLENAAKRLREDSVTLTKHLERIQKDSITLSLQNDSITKQNSQILQQRNDLDRTNHKLLSSNLQLAEERDNVLKANWKMMENQSRFIAEKANTLISEGSPNLATLLALEVLPNNLEKPNRPYVSDASDVLVKANQYDEAIINTNVPLHSNLSLSPNGDTIMVSSDSGIQLWSASCNEYITDFTELKGKAVFSPDGKLMVIAESSTWPKYTILIIDTQTGQCLHNLGAYINGKNASFSPDGSRIISHSDDVINIWDVKTGICTNSIKTTGFGDATFSSDGKYILVNESIDLQLLNATSGNHVRTFKGHKESPIFTTFSLDGQYLASCVNKDIRIWNVQSGICIMTIETEANINSVCFSNDTQAILASSSNGYLYLYDVKTGKCLNKRSLGDMGIDIALFDKNECNIIALTSNAIHVIKNAPTRCIKTIKGHYDFALPLQYGLSHYDDFLSFSPNGNYLLSKSDCRDSVDALSKIRIWDAKEGNIIHTLTSDNDFIGATFSPDNEFVLTQDKLHMKKWSLPTGMCVSTYQSKGRNPVYSPNGKYILLQDDKLLHFLLDEDDSGAHLIVLSDKDESVFMELIPSQPCNELSCHLFSPNGNLIAAFAERYPFSSYSNEILIWNTSTGECINHIDLKLDRVQKLWFSNDGEKIIGYVEYNNKVWDTECNRFIKSSLIIWDTFSAKIIKAINSITGRILGLSGNKVITESDNNIYIWDLEKGRCIDIISGHKSVITACVFSPDGQRIATTSMDRTIKIWETPISSLQSLIDEARKHFKDRQLTPEERKRYYLE